MCGNSCHGLAARRWLRSMSHARAIIVSCVNSTLKSASKYHQYSKETLTIMAFETASGLTLTMALSSRAARRNRPAIVGEIGGAVAAPAIAQITPETFAVAIFIIEGHAKPVNVSASE